VIERIHESFARKFGGVGTTAGSFVRIHVWAIVFLVVISLFAPARAGKLSVGALPQHVPPKARETAKILQRLSLDENDPRGFRKSPFGKSRFRVAWITGSEGGVYTADGKKGVTYVAALAAQALPKIDDREVGVDLYFLPAMRLGDVYFALLDAIKSKPDMIVVTLNPVWVLNPIATHEWTQLDASAATNLLGQPAQWPLAASLLSPADLAFGLAGDHLRAVADRASYSASLQANVKDLGPLNRAKLAPATARPSGLAETANFWFAHRLHEPSAPGPATWAKWIAESNKGHSALNDVLLHAIGKALRGTKIPSYVYLAQLNSGWLGTSSVDAALGGVERQLEDMRGTFTSDHILYQPQTASRFVQPLTFLAGDPVHMSGADALGPYLGQQLCTLAKQTGSRAACPAANGGNGSG